MFLSVRGSYNSYSVGAIRLPTWRTTPSCDTMRGGGGTVESTVATAGAGVSTGGGTLAGVLTIGCASGTGVGMGAGAGAGAVSAGAVEAIAGAEASCFKYIAATKA